MAKLLGKKRKLMDMEIHGQSVYQYKDGNYLSDGSQPCPENPQKYVPHTSTRYLNVRLGKNKVAQRKNGVEYIDCNKELPELYSKREKCCGCTACYAICPMSGPERPDIARQFRVDGSPEFVEVLCSGQSGVIEKMELTGAITMLPDEEGFLYPVVDAEMCVRCYKCLNACAFQEDQGKKANINSSGKIVISVAVS